MTKYGSNGAGSQRRNMIDELVNAIKSYQDDDVGNNTIQEELLDDSQISQRSMIVDKK